ncbi:glycoside hydrolase family 38 C-terminal domain-containing protein, partial [Streptomyces lasiicapitis]|uniref:glycoside hydrolase family 38 C-terminal domain-containing protein n=1 Tax=Streptomyces lasiicapitis TaxID=1923961 RepID=UPI0036BA0D12
RELIAKAGRLRDLEGSATVQWETPAAFFEKAEAEYPNAPVWVGELYLELHRATLTSQAGTKQGNRRSEHLLREAELWAATAAVRAGFPYPYQELDRIWKTVLLHQFHDILPGSSIAWVHREARATYAAVAADLNGIIGAAQKALAGDGSRGLVFNSAPHTRDGVAAGERRLDIDTEVDWHETEKFLKLAFPLDVHPERYASETQFGHFHRPTHTNTSWEAAKFEACNHRFVHVEEPGWGVALVNDSTYGHDVTRAVRDTDAGTTTTVRVSLLRAPRFPDPETDQGLHRFRHALAPGADVLDAVREGYRINLPERRVTGSGAEVAPRVAVDDDAVVVTAVKLADDGSGDVIVRFHEARGGRARTRLTFGFDVGSLAVTDLLERPLDGVSAPQRDGAEVSVTLRPFELVTLRAGRI